MDNYIVSARKYRPSTFDTVVGQQSITNTLKNAISNNHLAQAFLFCGPRGVGKTSCARILAKTINCFNATENTEACDNCDSCKGFNESHSFNIHELDAASNNGVDKIRELVDQVRFAPQIGKYSIYIIDEVHMLSQAAFNAFLKTLEEPPAHAIFILATTEKHKIIPTILSRCQIFDFKRIQIQDIVDHLSFVAEKENINADKDALHIIAQKADGALRDALSLFDQIVSFCGNDLNYEAVIQNLNILDYDYFFKATDALLSHHIPNSLNLFNEVLNNGFDGHNYINGLANHFRNLLVSKDPVTLSLLEVGDSIKERYQKQSQACDQAFLLRALDLCNKADLNYRISKNQRLLVEITLMQLCSPESIETSSAEKKTFNVKLDTSSQEISLPEEQKTVVATTTVENKTPEPTAPKLEEPTPVYESKAETNKKVVLNFKYQPSRKRTISINAKEVEEKVELKQTNDNKIVHQNDFSQDDVNKCWTNYCQDILKLGKHNLHTILKEKVGQLTENAGIEISLDNKVQEEVLNEEITHLLRFLKKELKNDTLTLNAVINQIEEKEMKAYTAEDQFKKMAEKNPTLLKMRDQFGLEIDF